MKVNNHVQDKIDSTLHALDDMGTVQVSPFFKEKTMQKLFTKKEEMPAIWAWFTPQVQLITFVCVLALNVLAFTKLQENTFDENVSEFANAFELTTSTQDIILKSTVKNINLNK